MHTKKPKTGLYRHYLIEISFHAVDLTDAVELLFKNINLETYR